MEPTLWYVLAAVLVIIGLAGTVLPVIPGALLIFGGLLLAAWADGFARVGLIGLSIIGALGVLSFVADFLGTLLGAKRVGASGKALFGAAIGGLVGILFGIPGLILGPFAGAVVGELIATRKLVQAGKVGVGTWVGLLVSSVLKVVIACLMVSTFAAFYLMNG